MQYPTLRSLLILPILFNCFACIAWASGLEVASATSFRNPDCIVITLHNGGSKPVISYGVSLLVMDGKTVVESSAYSIDRLDSVINAREQGGAADAWTGALLPGESYTQTLSRSFSSLSGQKTPLSVTAAVVSVLYSDGSSEGTNTVMLRDIRAHRKATALAEKRVQTILRGQQSDPDIQHRLGQIRDKLSALIQLPQVHGPTLTDKPYTIDPSVIQRVLQQVQGISKAAAPSDQLDAYTKHIDSRHSIRTSLLEQK